MSRSLSMRTLPVRSSDLNRDGSSRLFERPDRRPPPAPPPLAVLFVARAGLAALLVLLVLLVLLAPLVPPVAGRASVDDSRTFDDASESGWSSSACMCSASAAASSARNRSLASTSCP